MFVVLPGEISQPEIPAGSLTSLNGRFGRGF
jgi:hypothetical protein